MLLLAVFLPALSAGAERAPLKLVTGSDYAPYVDDRLPGGGPITQLVRQVFTRIGHPVTLTIEPWRRGYEGLLAHRYDASFPYIRTEQRTREMLFSDPIVAVRQHLVVAIGNEQAAMATGWMKGRRVCAAVGYGLPPWLDMLIQQGDVLRVTPTQQRSCLSMIVAGRADFMVEDDRIATARRAEAAEREKLATVPGPAASEATLHLIVARDHPDAQQILDGFNQGLAQLRADGIVPDLLLAKPPS
ncbi:substrate-binding periplasmic protein [Niveispirillum sp. KHB5.9]|uniref:substrate-binding periplasmic protein n=1 Tax=Niveispirillum sp. KHB5.9 TaxID=3400269 RepID=UPI003A83ED33